MNQAKKKKKEKNETKHKIKKHLIQIYNRVKRIVINITIIIIKILKIEIQEKQEPLKI